MGMFNFSHLEILAFIVVFVRISAMMAWFPIFGDRNTPLIMKILLSFVFSLIIYPVVRGYFPSQVPEEVISVVLWLGQEVTIGVLIGLIARCVFYAVSFGSQLISFQMGFGIVSVFDPNTSNRVSIVNQFQVVIATLIFLLMNMHHVFFGAVISSFQQVGPGTFSIQEGFLTEIVAITSTVFVTGFKMAAPVAGVLLLTSAGFGIVARAVPQMNVFMVSFPLTIGVGLLVIGLCMPLFVILLGKEFELIEGNILRMLKTI